jgi:hypothetical protein
VGVEPTGDGSARHPPVLKTGTITGPHALPAHYKEATNFSRATDRNESRLVNFNPTDLWESVESVAGSFL